MNKTKTQFVCIASTMRSGSTLLKALMAEADDVSNLPEHNFQKYAPNTEPPEHLGTHPIVVLKRPAWYTEIRTYPRLPNWKSLRVVLLVRDVVATVESLRKMTFRKLAPFAGPLVDSWLARKYWLGITRSLLEVHGNVATRSLLIRYEDLTARPIVETEKLFRFVGSQHTNGTDTYSKPDDFRWRWGSDDNSANIRSLKVQHRPAPLPSTRRLARAIHVPNIVAIRKQLGFPVPPPQK